jgi:endonuclease YncB( thermonuclease family)
MRNAAIIVMICFAFFATPCKSAKKDYGDIVINEVVSVYDGDTIRVTIKKFPPIIGENMPIRLNGFDTPELRSKDPIEKEKAYIARDYLRAEIATSKKIELRNCKRGKYFRIVGDLYLDNVDIGKVMIEKGLAVPYYGGSRK